MVRVHLLQVSLNLSDPEMESYLASDMVARNFCRVSSTRLFISDSTILRFRYFIEQHGLAQKFLERTANQAAEAGACSFDMVAADGTFIEAPSSTKNKAHARDPEMASGKKANTWHFGMKEHIAACSESGIIYGTVAAPANEHDITHLGDLLKGLEKKVFLDSGYSGCRKLKFRRFLSRTCHGTLLPGRAHGRRNCQSVRTLEANLVKRSSNA